MLEPNTALAELTSLRERRSALGGVLYYPADRERLTETVRALEDRVVCLKWGDRRVFKTELVVTSAGEVAGGRDGVYPRGLRLPLAQDRDRRAPPGAQIDRSGWLGLSGALLFL